MCFGRSKGKSVSQMYDEQKVDYGRSGLFLRRRLIEKLLR